MLPEVFPLHAAEQRVGGIDGYWLRLLVVVVAVVA